MESRSDSATAARLDQRVGRRSGGLRLSRSLGLLALRCGAARRLHLGGWNLRRPADPPVVPLHTRHGVEWRHLPSVDQPLPLSDAARQPIVHSATTRDGGCGSGEEGVGLIAPAADGECVLQALLRHRPRGADGVVVVDERSEDGEGRTGGRDRRVGLPRDLALERGRGRLTARMRGRCCLTRVLGLGLHLQSARNDGLLHVGGAVGGHAEVGERLQQRAGEGAGQLIVQLGHAGRLCGTRGNGGSRERGRCGSRRGRRGGSKLRLQYAWRGRDGLELRQARGAFEMCG